MQKLGEEEVIPIYIYITLFKDYFYYYKCLSKIKEHIILKKSVKNGRQSFSCAQSFISNNLFFL